MTAAGTFGDVLAELALEHAEAIERHGFDQSHDDAHDDGTWAWYLLRRVSELLTPAEVLDQSPGDRRRHLLEVAHIAASAVAAHDRRAVTVGGIVPGEDVGWTPTPVGTVTGGGLVVAAAKWYPTGPDGDGLDCLLVVRPGTDEVERHASTCTLYRPGPGVTCTGACLTIPTEETSDRPAAPA